MKWMRGLLVVLFFVAASGCSDTKDLVRWVSLEKALLLQQKQKQPILFYFYSKSCMYCKLMRMNTFSDPDVAKEINSAFVPVKLDIEENRDGEIPSGSKLASAFYIRGVPALVAVDADHRTLDSKMGFLTVHNTLSFIAEIAKSKGKGTPENEASGE